MVQSAQLHDCGDGHFALEGQLDFATVVPLLQTYPEQFAPHRRLTVDLAKVTRSNSAGVALLVEWWRFAVARDIELRWLNMPPQMAAIAAIAQLETLHPMFGAGDNPVGPAPGAPSKDSDGD